MESEIEKLYNKSIYNGRYQIITLILLFMIYGTAEYVVVILPFLTKMPIVNYYNDKTNIYYSKVLDYKICNNYKFELAEFQILSLVSELNIYCDRHLTTFISVSLFAGCAIASVITYKFADNFGRKYTILLFYILMSLSQFTFFFIANIFLMYFWFFFNGFIYTIVVLTIVVFVIELIEKTNLAIIMSLILTSMSFFGIFYAIFFYYVANWRLIFIIMGIIELLLAVLAYFYIEESPSFYYMNRNFDKFLETLYKISIKNKKTLYEDDFSLEIKEKETIIDNSKEQNEIINLNKSDSFKKGIEIEKNFHSLLKNNKASLLDISNPSHSRKESEDVNRIEFFPNSQSEILECYKNKVFDTPKKSLNDYNLLDLLRYRYYRRSFLILSLVWITVALITQGLSLIMKNFDNNLYLNSIYIFVLDIIFSFLTGFVSNISIFGRKRTLILLLLISLVSFMVLTPYLSNSYSPMYRYLIYISRISCISLNCLVYIYTNEIYPTVIRTKGLGTNKAFSKLASIFSHLIIFGLEFESVILIMGIVNIFAAILSFDLAETIKIPLKTTMEIESGLYDEF